MSPNIQPPAQQGKCPGYPSPLAPPPSQRAAPALRIALLETRCPCQEVPGP